MTKLKLTYNDPKLFPVTEYDSNHALEVNEYDSIAETYINGEWVPREGETVLKPGQTLDKDGYAKLWGVHGLDLILNDEPFFMSYEDTDDLFSYLVASGVILENELAHKEPRRWLEATGMTLVFRSKRDGVLFIERLNAFMHKKREKLLDFILYENTEKPCGICGEKPSLQKSLACEDCAEGGDPISEMMHLSSSSYCLACNKEHPHRAKICVQCAGEGWYLDDSQRVCLESGQRDE